MESDRVYDFQRSACICERGSVPSPSIARRPGLRTGHFIRKLLKAWDDVGHVCLRAQTVLELNMIATRSSHRAC